MLNTLILRTNQSRLPIRTTSLHRTKCLLPSCLGKFHCTQNDFLKYFRNSGHTRFYSLSIAHINFCSAGSSPKPPRYSSCKLDHIYHVQQPHRWIRGISGTTPPLWTRLGRGPIWKLVFMVKMTSQTGVTIVFLEMQILLTTSHLLLLGIILF